MLHLLLPIHLLAAGVWFGCVLTEILFERAFLGQGRSHEFILARLHRRVDLLIELPALLVVALSGAALLHAAAPGALLHLKISLGAIAMVANLICLSLVLRRFEAARRTDWKAFANLDRAQHAWGAVVLLGIVGALTLGLWRYAHL
jgi:hypothetical protein